MSTLGPLRWWANRKSRIGISPVSRPPPHHPGGLPWWTSLPTAAPQPEYVEHAVQFLMELQRRRGERVTAAETPLPEKIEQVMGTLRVSHSVLARALGVKRQALYAWRRGLHVPGESHGAVLDALHAISSRLRDQQRALPSEPEPHIAHAAVAREIRARLVAGIGAVVTRGLTAGIFEDTP